MKRIVWAIVVTALFLLSGRAVSAQASDAVTVEVDRKQATTDDVLTLTVRLDEGAGASGEPELPLLDGFEVLGSNSYRQVSLVSTNLSVSTVYQYSLRPTRTGTLEIGPITVSVNGQPVQTVPIQVTVGQGTGNPSAPPSGMNPFPNLPNFPNLGNLPNFPSMPGQPGSPGQEPDTIDGGTLDPSEIPAGLQGQSFFVEARVDNPAPYQGQQVLYTFRFYQSEELWEGPEYNGPAFTGLWHEQLDSQTEYLAQAGGRNYRVTELTTVLFPTVVGEVTIEPAELTVPAGFFGNGDILRTEPVTLDVRPLPDPAPAGFNGAVGEFELAAEPDRTEIALDETVTWRVTIQGAGNMDNLPDPIWPDDAEWRAFESQAEVQADLTDGVWQGTRIYERVLVPTRAGDLTLPPLEYRYFNPRTGTYETATTPGATVRVAGQPDTVGSVTPSPAEDVPVSAAGGVLRPLKSAVPATAAEPLTARPLYWLLWLLPVALVAGQYGWRYWRARYAASAEERRRQGAAKAAHRALRGAHTGDLAGTILLNYLEQRLGRPLRGLTRPALGIALAAAGLPAQRVDQIDQILEMSDLSRYAPAGAEQGSPLLAATGQVIDAVEADLGAA